MPHVLLTVQCSRAARAHWDHVQHRRSLSCRYYHPEILLIQKSIFFLSSWQTFQPENFPLAGVASSIEPALAFAYGGI